MATLPQPGIDRREDKTNDFRRIVVATDFSPAAEKALKYAAAIGREYHSEISVVNAVAREPRQAMPMDPLPRELDAAYCEARNQMRKLDQEPSLRGILYRTVVQHGTASDVVSSIIDHEKADLLVVGTEGRTGFTKMALGSVAEELLRVANCPVLSVSRIAAAVPELANFKTIVFATDFGPASERAFQYAARIADHFKAKLMLLHTVSPIPEFEPVPGYMPPATAVEAVKQWEHRVRDEALSKLKVLASSYSKSLETTYTVTIDFSPTAILDFVARHTPELLVMGAQRVQSPRLVAHLPWGVLHGVLSGTPCPVLTILG